MKLKVQQDNIANTISFSYLADVLGLPVDRVLQVDVGDDIWVVRHARLVDAATASQYARHCRQAATYAMYSVPPLKLYVAWMIVPAMALDVNTMS